MRQILFHSAATRDRFFKRCAAFLFFFFLLNFCAACTIVVAAEGEYDASPSQRGDATIFIYHRFGDDRFPTTNVSTVRFKEQMHYLAQNNYQVVALAELVEMLKNNLPLPERLAVITIDDGYSTVYTEAWPVLKSYDFPFTVFLYVEAIDRGYKDFMTWEQVREMQKAGVDFQDHSYSHHRLAQWSQGMTEKEYRAWIAADLAKGYAILSNNLGHPPRFFAIPYGEYNSIVIEEAKAIGYDAIFTQDPGSVSKDTEVFQIPREPILGDDWSTLGHFETVLKRVDLPLTDMMPGITPLANKAPPRFGARLLYPERYEQGSFGIYVSELGWHNAQRNGDVVAIDNEVALTRPTNRVMVSAKEKKTGRMAVRFWLLVNK